MPMLPYLRDFLYRRRVNQLRRTMRPGSTVSRFIARDVKREVLVVSADEIETGFVTARIRTTNVLYLSKGFVNKPEFGPVERIAVEKLWEWSGHFWGGLPDGTSIVDHVEPNSSKPKVMG